MAKREGKMIRVADDVVFALRIFAGKVQQGTGSPITDSDAVRAALEVADPESLVKGQELAKKSSVKKKDIKAE